VWRAREDNFELKRFGSLSRGGASLGGC